MIVNVTLLKLSDLLYLQLLVNISVIRSTDSLVITGIYIEQFYNNEQAVYHSITCILHFFSWEVQ